MKIGGLEIWPPLLLAPMAGLTHSALRTTLLGFGGVGLLSTEMLSATRLPIENAQLSPYLIRTAEESPLSHQLLLADEKPVAKACVALHRLGADVIDLNLGCPAPTVRKVGGGSRLMENPDQVRRIVACARKNTHLPLSAKIRLGETLDAEKLRNFCLMLVGEGVDMVTVHARLRGEPFTRTPRWDWVGKVKGWIDVPVVANGGIDSATSARLCLEQSGADGLMIGRAAAQTPWLFAVLGREIFGAEIPEPKVCLPRVYQAYVAALVQRFLPERRLGRLKEFTHYFAGNYFFGHHLAAKVQSSLTLEAAWARALEFFAENDPLVESLPSPFASVSAEADCSTQSPAMGT